MTESVHRCELGQGYKLELALKTQIILSDSIFRVFFSISSGMSDVVMSWKSHSGDRKAIGTSVDQGIASNVIMTIISAESNGIGPVGGSVLPSAIYYYKTIPHCKTCAIIV